MYMVARNRRTRQRRSKQRKTRRQRGGVSVTRLIIPPGCKLLPVTDPDFAKNTLKLLNSPDDACVASAWEQYKAIPLTDKQMIKGGPPLFRKASLDFYTLEKKMLTQHRGAQAPATSSATYPYL